MSLHPISQVAPNLNVAAFRKLARCIAASDGSVFHARDIAVQSRAVPDVQAVLKSAVEAATLDPSSWSSGVEQYQMLVQAFTDSLRSWSAYDAMRGSMMTVPLRSKVALMTTAPSASIVGEAQHKPLTSMAFDLSDAIEPVKAVAMVACTKELLRFALPGSTELFDAALAQAVAESTDKYFLAAMVDETTPTPSAGSTSDNCLTDISVLVNAVTTYSNSRLFLVVEPAAAKKMVLKRTSGGSPIFPGLGVNGGQIAPGIQCVVSGQLASGYALMIDAQGVVAGQDTMVLDSSDQATLEFSTTPSSPPVAATVMRSLWQEGLRVLRAEREFGFRLMRTSAVASLSGVSY